jgi:hypothetical protein
LNLRIAKLSLFSPDIRTVPRVETMASRRSSRQRLNPLLLILTILWILIESFLAIRWHVVEHLDAKLGPSSPTRVRALNETIQNHNMSRFISNDKDPNLAELLIPTNIILKQPSSVATKPTTIAYAISVTDCPINHTYTILDGAATLSHSIRMNSIRSSNKANVSLYDYALFAFVHVDAIACVPPLRRLGYAVHLKSELPFDISVVPPRLREAMEEKGCCGSKEFLKLYVYSLTEYSIAVHLDTDTLVVRPMDELWDNMLSENAQTSPLPTHHVAAIQHHQSTHNATTPAVRPDFFFTRDYHQQAQSSNNPKHYGVQGGFLVVRPNQTLLEEFSSRILHEEYHTRLGWSKLGYGGYWGASQIQGFLSYVYGEYYSDRAFELNRCLYNTMIHDDPYEKRNGTCRTKEDACDDCRDTNWTDVYLVHLTTCRKPWECPYLRKPTPPLCRTAHRAWFETRRQLELEWNQTPPRGGWHSEWTLGYCTKPKDSKRRVYRPLEIPE